MRRRPSLFVAIVVLLLAGTTLAACGDSDPTSSPATDTSNDTAGGDPNGKFVAQVASFELVANQDQRFLAALAGNGTGKVVSFGAVDLDFSYLGTRQKPVDPPQRRTSAKAQFLPVAGQKVDATAAGPKEANPSEGLGVYAAEPVRFDTAGFWGVTIRATIGGTEVRANAPFEVYAESRLPAPGQPAPRTDNPIAGAAGVEPSAIDSRATGSAPIPDPALHATSIAGALSAGKPVLVVVSTPVYCVSRFCGPVTDTAAQLAATYGDRVAFVHLEVWQNFEKKIINPAASEWISPKGGQGDTQEPWVFLVDKTGTIAKRFDNVVNESVLDTAIKGVLER